MFCEKPISKSDEGTAKCYDLAKKMGRTLFCGFQRRFDPSIRSIYDKVRSGAVGHANVIKSTSRDSQLSSLTYLKVMILDLDLEYTLMTTLPDLRRNIP